MGQISNVLILDWGLPNVGELADGIGACFAISIITDSPRKHTQPNNSGTLFHHQPPPPSRPSFPPVALRMYSSTLTYGVLFIVVFSIIVFIVLFGPSPRFR